MLPATRAAVEALARVNAAALVTAARAELAKGRLAYRQGERVRVSCGAEERAAAERRVRRAFTFRDTVTQALVDVLTLRLEEEGVFAFGSLNLEAEDALYDAAAEAYRVAGLREVDRLWTASTQEATPEPETAP